MNRKLLFALGTAAVLAETALWHGPLGTGEGIAVRTEQAARAELDRLEMVQVQARVGRAPLTRQLKLSGTADDFQRSELVRIMGDTGAASSARWIDAGPGRAIPLLLEAVLAALLAFLTGLLLAYLIELRRRANAEWRW